MDIETWEYFWIDALETKHLKKIKQIVIEFHYTHQDSDIADRVFRTRSHVIPPKKRIESLKKLEKTHYLVHFHPNNYCLTTNYKNVILPNVYECTYLLKDSCKHLSYSKETIPNYRLDVPNSNKKIININYYPFVKDY